MELYPVKNLAEVNWRSHFRFLFIGIQGKNYLEKVHLLGEEVI